MHSNVPSPQIQSANAPSKLEKLFETMDNVRKQLRALHKQWEQEGNPARRMELRHQIQALEEMLDTIRQQVIMLTQMENRRKDQHSQELRTTAVDPTSSQQDTTRASSSEDPGVYYPPGQAPQT
jgi:uncharacterized coiled-coil DUF342 family protein